MLCNKLVAQKPSQSFILLDPKIALPSGHQRHEFQFASTLDTSNLGMTRHCYAYIFKAIYYKANETANEIVMQGKKKRKKREAGKKGYVQHGFTVKFESFVEAHRLQLMTSLNHHPPQ